jgi:hypothetical protein
MPIALPLPRGVPVDRLRAALTEAPALRRWWDPDATITRARLSPGIGGGPLRVRRHQREVLWEGEGIHVGWPIDWPDAPILVDAGALAEADEADVAAGWGLAVSALAWALGHDDPVRWVRAEVPVALSYGDAWSRIDGPEGLAGFATTVGGTGTVRIAGVRYAARLVYSEPPRAVALVLPELGGALLRL